MAWRRAGPGMCPVVPAGAPAATGVEVWAVVEDGELEAPRVDEAAEHGVQIFTARKLTKLSRVEDDHDALCETRFRSGDRN